MSKPDPLVVPAGARIEGTLEVQADVWIQGRVIGRVVSTESVNIGAGANVQANVQAGRVRVQGHLEGDVRSAGAVSIGPKGVLIGDVMCKELRRAEGSRFQGVLQKHSQAPGEGQQGPRPSMSRVPQLPSGAYQPIDDDLPHDPKERRRQIEELKDIYLAELEEPLKDEQGREGPMSSGEIRFFETD